MTKNVNGTALATFSVAVNDPRRKDDPPMWIRSQLWGKRAENGIVNHLTKGVQVAVTGALKIHEYTRNDGLPGFSLDLNVEQLQLLSGKGNASVEAPVPFE